jgi:hypothetical protein
MKWFLFNTPPRKSAPKFPPQGWAFGYNSGESFRNDRLDTDSLLDGINPLIADGQGATGGKIYDKARLGPSD